METWKEIEGFEGYQISSFGNLKSKKLNKKEKILKHRIDKYGYNKFSIWKNNKQYYFLAHRLVAIAFIENKENKKQINHINGIKNDNRIENLEWNSRSENMLHSYEILKRNKKHREVIRYNNIEKKTYNSIKEAATDNNVTRPSISQCLSGRSKKCNGYKWKYLEND